MEIPEILYEDNHLIVVNKKVSDIVQGDKTGDKPLSEKIKEYIKHEYDKPGEVFLGVAHRLDRPVSGIVLFARTSKALARLNKMFAEKQIKKKYWAIVKNKPPKNEDTITHYLTRNEKQNKSFASDIEQPGSKAATLTYKLIARLETYYLLEIDLHTGKHHQIRSQLSKINCPIKGDLKYGFPRSNEDTGISLHAREISFEHPVKKTLLKILAPAPNGILWDEFIKLVGN